MVLTTGGAFSLWHSCIISSSTLPVIIYPSQLLCSLLLTMSCEKSKSNSVGTGEVKSTSLHSFAYSHGKTLLFPCQLPHVCIPPAPPACVWWGERPRWGAADTSRVKERWKWRPRNVRKSGLRREKRAERIQDVMDNQGMSGGLHLPHSCCGLFLFHHEATVPPCVHRWFLQDLCSGSTYETKVLISDVIIHMDGFISCKESQSMCRLRTSDVLDQKPTGHVSLMQHFWRMLFYIYVCFCLLCPRGLPECLSRLGL